jgi:NADH-quinone oxidoreductase subunit E
MSSTSATLPKQQEGSRERDISGLIDRFKGKPGALLGVLEEAQGLERLKYLPEATLRLIAEGMGLPLSQVYSVATFYSFFNLTPQGLHSIVVCRGTACHTRGSLELLETCLHHMGIKGFREDEASSVTTIDGFASIRTVACFGQCALAPVVQIDGAISSRMTVGKLTVAIDRLRKGGGQ